MRQHANTVVAVYFVDTAYGGPEEGGWWYTRGDLVRTMRVFKAGQEAQLRAYVNRLQDKLDATLNRGRRPISSVLSAGKYSVEVYDDMAPQHFPECRPHYE